MPDPVTRLNAALEGRYRIESELGEGGMATVYLTDDIKHERKVALKVFALHGEIGDQVGRLSDVLRDMTPLGQVRHLMEEVGFDA